MRKKRGNDITTGGLLMLLLVLAINLLKGGFSPAEPDRTAPYKEILIQVSGDIKNPGIYGYHHPPHLMELVTNAGGPNLRSRKPVMLKDILLSSGRRIEVMGKGEKTKIIESEMSPFHKITLALPIWLNRETMEGLTAVPGIGLKTAGNIVFERAKKGGFKRLEDLRSVKGIGPVMYDKIRLYLAL